MFLFVHVVDFDEKYGAPSLGKPGGYRKACTNISKKYLIGGFQ